MGFWNILQNNRNINLYTGSIINFLDLENLYPLDQRMLKYQTKNNNKKNNMLNV